MLEGLNHIHVLGASGSGTTTLARHLSSEFGHVFLDTDDFFWEQTDPPYTTSRPADQRITLLQAALQGHPRWVISGSLCGWGDVLIPEFDLVAFLWLPPEERLDRIKARELQRYGSAALAPGGKMHASHQKFMAWAAKYDTADSSIRSLQRHRAWMKKLPCRVTQVPGNVPFAEQFQVLVSAC